MFKRPIALTVATLLLATSAQAQPKDIKTAKGKAVALLNLVSNLSNCAEGSVFLPKLPREPEHGSVQLMVGNVAIAANGQCPARTVKAVVVIYVPKPDFVGNEELQIDISDGNRTTSVSYNVIVQDAPFPDNKL